MAKLKDTEINGNLHVTEDVQIGEMSVSEKLDELETNTVISSDEVKTRDLFFGKPVYTKTIRYTTNVTSGQTNAVPHEISNINTIWIDLSNSYITNANYVFPLTVSYYMSGFDNCCPYVDKTNIYFASQGTWGTNWTKSITVRYTKTTDTAI